MCCHVVCTQGMFSMRSRIFLAFARFFRTRYSSRTAQNASTVPMPIAMMSFRFTSYMRACMCACANLRVRGGCVRAYIRCVCACMHVCMCVPLFTRTSGVSVIRRGRCEQNLVPSKIVVALPQCHGPALVLEASWQYFISSTLHLPCSQDHKSSATQNHF